MESFYDSTPKKYEIIVWLIIYSIGSNNYDLNSIDYLV